MPIEENAITFKDVSVNRGKLCILESVSASVPRGSCTAIVGPNGAGKTTLIFALLGQIPYEGSIELQSVRDNNSRIRIGYVPQRLDFDRAVPITVLEFMLMGMQRRPLWFGSNQKAVSKAVELLSAVKADTLDKRKLSELSGGELQRVLVALALEQEPELLVMDEPASGVDLEGGQLFCELLDGLRGEWGFTQLMVSHDLPTVTHHANHVICLNRRVAAEGTPQEVLTKETLSKIFGLHMGLIDSRAMPLVGSCCSATCCEEKRNGDSHA